MQSSVQPQDFLDLGYQSPPQLFSTSVHRQLAGAVSPPDCEMFRCPPCGCGRCNLALLASVVTLLCSFSFIMRNTYVLSNVSVVLAEPTATRAQLPLQKTGVVVRAAASSKSGTVIIPSGLTLLASDTNLGVRSKTPNEFADSMAGLY